MSINCFCGDHNFEVRHRHTVSKKEVCVISWCSTCGAYQEEVITKTDDEGLDRKKNIAARSRHVTVPLWLRQSMADKSRLTNVEERLAMDGQKIPAIKQIRQRTGLGLKEALDLYNSFWTGLSNGYDHPRQHDTSDDSHHD